MKLSAAAALLSVVLLVPQAFGGEEDELQRQLLELAKDMATLERSRVATKADLSRVAAKFDASTDHPVPQQIRRQLALLDARLADRRQQLEMVMDRRIDLRLASLEAGRDVPDDGWLYEALAEDRAYEVFAIEGRSLLRRLAASTDPQEIAQLKQWVDRRKAIQARLVEEASSADRVKPSVDETVQARGVVINTFGGERSDLPPKELSVGEANALARREFLARTRKGLEADSRGARRLDTSLARFEEVLRIYDRAREAWFTGRREEAHQLVTDAGAALEIALEAAEREEAGLARLPTRRPDETGRVFLHAEDAAVRQVLMTIGRQAPVGVTWPADLYGRVTLQVEDLPWRRALDLVLAAVGWKAVEDRPPAEGQMGSLRLVRVAGGQIEPTALQSLHEEIRALRREVQEIKRILLAR